MIFKKKKYQKHFMAIFALFVYLSMVFAFTVSQVMNKSKQWERSLDSSMTIELPARADINSSVKQIRKIDGVKVVKAMDDNVKEEILSKWLGEIDISRMPISDIIEVKTSKERSLADIKQDIESSISGAKVFSNMDWGKDIFEVTKAIFYMCSFLFVLIVLVSVVLINFMVKTLLNTYSKEIDILHLNGASDVFISAMLQRNIFIQSLKASFIGVFLSNVTWMLLSRYLNIDYSFGGQDIINGTLIVLLISLMSSFLVKLNVEKELRL